jgi:hypothetical protein
VDALAELSEAEDPAAVEDRGTVGRRERIRLQIAGRKVWHRVGHALFSTDRLLRPTGLVGASDPASHITGRRLSVKGGYSMISPDGGILLATCRYAQEEVSR